MAYRVSSGVTHVNGALVKSDTVWLTSAEAAFDLAHGRVSLDRVLPARRKRRRVQKGDGDGRD
ncbi:hypothetical protein [Mycoplana rhizolycopersici]|uniref:Uncharacterized protein n=1 Tax=Mycoplana rhizolycopersici TaxID=2746702 RepID=A0ABX2QHK2_9HYPH|nr:hypothetical protein [Rhizobium rhizolycopersici]NVP56088.1 hypothetical protein [Rhizobium rhizolycopersici]